MPKQTELASALRAWRDRVRPEEVGLPGGGRRRAAGLRREELAALAGVSVDYLVRLEQGRSANPSPQVLASLARALRLTDAERELLYRSAGAASPQATTISRHIGPGIQRVLDRLQDTPAAVYTVSWERLLANQLWQALFGEREVPTGRERNFIWRFFTRDQSFAVQTAEEKAALAATMVSDLHDATARYPGDRDLAAMVRELRAKSEEFDRLWDTYTVKPHVSNHKTILSPTVGRVTVDCDILTVPASDLRIVVYTAQPGSADADKLDLLRVTGIQLL
jgi:transcriptional regulator with XRE-family HTH domain